MMIKRTIEKLLFEKVFKGKTIIVTVSGQTAKDGVITGFEFKWNPRAKTNISQNSTKAYNANVTIVTNEILEIS